MIKVIFELTHLGILHINMSNYALNLKCDLQCLCFMFLSAKDTYSWSL